VAVAGLDGAHLSDGVALTTYYVVTEALVNVAKHAGAATARVELSAGAGRVDVRVVDDGRGGADEGGGGLRGLRDRVAAVGGELRVTSPPGGGTVVAAMLPLRRDET
jgi:signal transduction histidine kinase